MTKIVFVPGNGNSTKQDNWFPSLQADFEKEGLEVVASEFLGPVLTRESYWMPFLIDELKVDEEMLLVGYSSGAVAAMRLAEKHVLKLP